jgi:serine/threonine-protein kinase
MFTIVKSDARIEHLVRRWKELRDQGTPASSQELCRNCPELLPAFQEWLDAHGESVAAESARSELSRERESAVRSNVIVLNPKERAEQEQCDTLRRRLQLINLIFLMSWVPVFAAAILIHERIDLASFAAVAVIVVGSSVALARRRTWSFAALRWFEFAIFAIATFGVAAGQASFYAGGGLVHMLQANDDEKMVMLANTLSYTWFILIVLYGTIIPNSWRRCAVIVGSIALLPVALLACFSYFHGLLGNPLIQACLIKLVLQLSFGVGIAMFASFRMDQLQQQVVDARKLGQYVLKRCLGKGGMGEVYLAEHQMLRRDCAVKLIRRDRIASVHDQQRFEREVQVLANLSHGNIVEVYDYGMEADGTFYFVMEYLSGLTLHEMVERFGPVPPGRAIHFLRQVASALGAAHARGVIHRDIKPANVIVCEKGGVKDVVKLLDFGLVQLSRSKDEARLTHVGGVVGTPAFMSPEQIAAAPTLDARSDIYSVGVLAYYLLTGRNPFDRPEVRDILTAHREDAPPLGLLAAGIHADLEQVVARCLAREPAGRFADAARLEEALAACRSAGAWTPADADAWWREHAVLPPLRSLPLPK